MKNESYLRLNLRRVVSRTKADHKSQFNMQNKTEHFKSRQRALL